MGKYLIYSVVLFHALNLFAVVKRHDVAPESYSLEQAPDYFINMPHEGSGVLIDRYWLLSAAHVIYYDGYEGKTITIHGIENTIEKVVFHPTYIKQTKEAFSGDAKPLMDFLYKRSDLVLLKLSKPVTHVEPIARYYGNDELGKQTLTIGTGATGTGLSGELIATKTKRPLNMFRNHIEGVTERHLKMRFDSPDKGLPLEGIHGSGDSGGPTVMMFDDKEYLIGIQSFRDYEGDLKDFKGALYGSVSVLCRVSAFNDWNDDTINKHSK